MQWQVACDFDGTIAVEDVTDSVLARFADPAWQEIEAEWKAGRIGSRECMARQVDLVRCHPVELDRHLDRIEIDPAFPSFVSYCRRQSIPLRVVSDGLDYVIRRILGRYGLGDLPIMANRLERLADGRYRLGFPHALDNCSAASGTCKCAALKRPTSELRHTVLIGDGASDFCGATTADLVFAKDRLLAHCERRRLPYVPFADFAEVRRLLAALLRTPARTAVPAASELVEQPSAFGAGE
jgi:2-hydroxy-3-keto-5-methylthiopentenyl-1-phosphate phosphatase